MERVLQKQAEALADDIPIEDCMAEWSDEALDDYFHSGGSVRPAPRKPRILCLHGTASNESILRMQCARIFSKLHGMEIHIVEGPLQCSESSEQLQLMKSFFGENHKYCEYAPAQTDADGRRTYPDVEGRCAEIEARARSLSDSFDGLLGFSQGANFATMLAARAERCLPGALSHVGCVVLLAPSEPGWVHQLDGLFTTPLETAALVVGGEQDRVAKRGPGECAALFKRQGVAKAAVARMLAPRSCAVAVTHSEGHRPLPSNPAEAQALATTISDFLREHSRCS